MREMPGQLGNLKSRKRKRSSEISPSGRRRSARSMTDASSTTRPDKPADPVERLSRIACECLKSAAGRRCSASPEPEGQDGKENELRTEEDNSCAANDTWDKPESEHMDCEENRRAFFPDDDSNQILPVEQFFGNMDVVQDFPQRSSDAPSSVQRSSAAHSSVQRSSAAPSIIQRKERRRHYYAREDSNEEEAGLGVTQRDEVST